jgi:hypothetical protein
VSTSYSDAVIKALLHRMAVRGTSPWMIIQDLGIRIVHATTGELLRSSSSAN